MTDTKLSHSESQAVAQLESIKEMIAALQCNYDRLEELRDERQAFIDEWKEEHPDAAENARAEWESANPDEATELAELEEEAGECESQDDAQQRIQEDPLSIEVRSGWYTLDADADKSPAEYCVLLCTGGPACRIIGDLENGQPTSARLQHQDWGTPWTEHLVLDGDYEALMEYVRQFYYGE